MTIWNLTYHELFSECFLNSTWKEIRRDSRYVTGGLGEMMMVNKYEVWVCAPHGGNYFAKVLYLVALYRKCTRAMTFKNL
jgi:flavoprotein